MAAPSWYRRSVALDRVADDRPSEKKVDAARDALDVARDIYSYSECPNVRIRMYAKALSDADLAALVDAARVFVRYERSCRATDLILVAREVFPRVNKHTRKDHHDALGILSALRGEAAARVEQYRKAASLLAKAAK
jgi:hypothetical protein